MAARTPGFFYIGRTLRAMSAHTHVGLSLSLVQTGLSSGTRFRINLRTGLDVAQAARLLRQLAFHSLIRMSVALTIVPSSMTTSSSPAGEYPAN